MPRIAVNHANGHSLFFFEQCSPVAPLDRFHCPIDEYNGYLVRDALRSQNDRIALTWLLREKAAGGIVAYMSLIADAIKLSVSEKELHLLNYPFKTVPAMKIAKLAVSSSHQKKYRGVGSFMVTSALLFAQECNERYFACRFLTADADTEHNESVLAFYQKNGFLVNGEMNNKKRNNISMEAVPKLQFWGDKLRKAGNLRFRACSVANKVCALTEFWNRLMRKDIYF